MFLEPPRRHGKRPRVRAQACDPVVEEDQGPAGSRSVLPLTPAQLLDSAPDHGLVCDFTALSVINTSYAGSRVSNSRLRSSSVASPCRNEIAASTFPLASTSTSSAGNASSNSRRADREVNAQYQLLRHSSLEIWLIPGKVASKTPPGL